MKSGLMVLVDTPPTSVLAGVVVVLADELAAAGRALVES